MKVQAENSGQLFSVNGLSQIFIELKPLSSEWCSEYCNGNEDYANKLKVATAEYTNIRLMNKDGNCFYRAMLIAILEKINGDPDKYLPIYKQIAKNYFDDLLSKDYPKITVSDFYDIFINLIANVFESSEDSNGSSLMEAFITKLMLNSETVNYCFVFMRLVLSCYLQNHASDYALYLSDGITVENFCKNHVEPIDTYCDNIQINALAKVFDINVKILSISPNTCFSYNIPDESTSTDLHLIYNNLHYDILYK